MIKKTKTFSNILNKSYYYIEIWILKCFLIQHSINMEIFETFNRINLFDKRRKTREDFIFIINLISIKLSMILSILFNFT